jgi:ribosome maturation factor RimP
MKTSVNERIKDTAFRVAEENGLEFVHARIAGTSKNLSICIFIDKPGGVTHEDCVKVSRSLDTILDVEDFIPSAYLLEVSSPGLERELYSKEDFEKFVGSTAKVKTSVPTSGQRNFRGYISAVEGDDIVFEDKTSGTIRFPYSAVAKANLEIDLNEELKRNGKWEAKNKQS